MIFIIITTDEGGQAVACENLAWVGDRWAVSLLLGDETIVQFPAN